MTVLPEASITGSGPSSIWYRWPCSPSGFQSVCTTIFAGQTPDRSIFGPDADCAVGLLELVPADDPAAQPVRASAVAARAAVATPRREVVRMEAPFVVRVSWCCGYGDRVVGGEGWIS